MAFIMKRVLVLGTGYVVKPLVDYFIDHCVAIPGKLESVYKEPERLLLRSVSSARNETLSEFSNDIDEPKRIKGSIAGCVRSPE